MFPVSMYENKKWFSVYVTDRERERRTVNEGQWLNIFICTRVHIKVNHQPTEVTLTQIQN